MTDLEEEVLVDDITDDVMKDISKGKLYKICCDLYGMNGIDLKNDDWIFNFLLRVFDEEKEPWEIINRVSQHITATLFIQDKFMELS